MKEKKMAKSVKKRKTAESSGWDKYIPKRRIGCLSPLQLIENGPFEFYHLAPKDVMTIYVSVGLAKFTAEDVERVFEPIDKLVASLMARNCDTIVQSGTPLPILIGVKAHDKLMKRIETSSGKVAGSTVAAVTASAAHMGIKNIALANKWTPEMNKTLGEFFARDGVKVAGVASEPMSPDKFPGLTTEHGMELAYQLGKAAIEQNPKADGLYVGGGAWKCFPVVLRLEKEYGIPCISNQDASLWHSLHQIDYWRPIKGFNALLASK
jgi:maleate isomerase